MVHSFCSEESVSRSTLLRMMAGVEQPSNGDARLMPGFTVGLLDQEPRLDESKTVLANVEDGVAETKRLLNEYNEIAEKMATDYSDELLEQMGQLQEQLNHRDAWDLDSQVEQAMDALRCPPPEADVTSLSGGEKRRVALCRLLLSWSRWRTWSRGSATGCCSRSCRSACLATESSASWAPTGSATRTRTCGRRSPTARRLSASATFVKECNEDELAEETAREPPHPEVF